jgi:hypothetical protein
MSARAQRLFAKKHTMVRKKVEQVFENAAPISVPENGTSFGSRKWSQVLPQGTLPPCFGSNNATFFQSSGPKTGAGFRHQKQVRFFIGFSSFWSTPVADLIIGNCPAWRYLAGPINPPIASNETSMHRFERAPK